MLGHHALSGKFKASADKRRGFVPQRYSDKDERVTEKDIEMDESPGAASDSLSSLDSLLL